MNRLWQIYIVLISLFVASITGCDSSEEPPPSVVITQEMETAGSEGDPELEKCEQLCSFVLACSDLISCGEPVLTEASNSCYQSCQDTSRRANVLALDGQSCSDAVNNAVMLFGLTDRCLNGTCNGQMCPEQQTCDRQRGVCYDPCMEQNCPAGSVCDMGRCIDLCEDVTCDAGLGCRDGQCMDLCLGVTCGDDQLCDTETGECVSRCQNINCRNGERCEADTGMCIPNCQNIVCGGGGACDDRTGRCVNLCTDVVE